MNEKHMQYVLTVLKEGSFTGAAKKLYVSQPSLSQIIKAAEANLGAPIFNRNTDPITLTPAGALYVKAAKQISTISTNLAKQVEELSNEEFGKIRLGISVQRGMELLPYLYPRFKSRFPHVELELHEQGSATMEESVLEGSVGIALLTTFPKYDELVYDLIQKENMVLLVNKACALAERIRPGTPIDIREAADEVFICSRQGHSARTILDALCAARNMKPEIGLETISIEVGKYVVATSPVVRPARRLRRYGEFTSPHIPTPSWEWRIPGIFLPATGRTCISQNICGIFWSCSTRSGTSPPAVTARRREQRPSPS
ncbi:MAG: LysR family transcriptional regulator [Enterocloster sp.]